MSHGRVGRALACWALVLGLMPAWARAQAPDPAEAESFNAAAWAFQDGAYDRAAKELGAFVSSFPKSERVPEAILLQARAALELKDPVQAIVLLTTNVTRAGTWADRYQYWLAESHLSATNYEAAIEACARLIQEFPKSTRLLEASYKQAWAKFQMGDLAAAVKLLRDPAGTFQTAAQTRTNDVVVAEGHFLLAEALLRQKECRAAEQALQALTNQTLIPDAQWRRQELLCRIQVADRRLEEALASTTNLLAFASLTGRRSWLAESVVLQATLLEDLNQYAAAAVAYEPNLVEGMPEERRRQALLKILELTLRQGKVAEGIQRLEIFCAQRSQDPAADLALLTLGELHLRELIKGMETNRLEHPAPPSPPGPTNHMQQALACFDRLLTNYNQSPLLGNAQMGRGWCYWVDGNWAESLAAFRAAAELLKPSENQAVARFKWADLLFRQGDHTNAITQFRGLLADYADSPPVKKQLFGHAYYQLLRASLTIGDLATATGAMRKLLDEYPESSFRDPGLLLVGQAVAAGGDRASARAIYKEFASRFPESALLPEVVLAWARAYAEEENWTAALEHYNQWVSRFPTNELLPRAEYDRAWVSYRAGQETNALALFTNFVARFPTNELTPRALYWVGDFYFQKKDFVSAQINYQKVAENFPGTPLSYQARMMAGRSAYSSRFWKDAAGPSGHFTSLVNDNNCPPDLAAEAFFALGDTLLELGQPSPDQPLKRFADAIVIFSKIPDLFPTNRLVPLAWGRIGDCYLQLGQQDAKNLDSATNAYQKVLESPLADWAAKCQAEFGLGLVCEKRAGSRPSPERETLLQAALNRYQNVVYGKVGGVTGNPDPFWLKKAGLAAAQIAEDQKQWELAANLYQRLLKVLPPLGTALQKKLQKALEQLGQQGG